MTATLVDSSVLLDVLTEDPRWFDWSSEHLARCAEGGPLVINPIIYGEISVRFTRIEELDAALGSDFERRPLPWAVAFLAGKAFLTHRRRGGSKRSPLPDFYIGAHAALEGLSLLTRDASRYRRYYPRLTLLGP